MGCYVFIVIHDLIQEDAASPPTPADRPLHVGVILEYAYIKDITLCSGLSIT